MEESRKKSRWFYRAPTTDKMAGPFDFLELAGFLQTGDITAETLTRVDEDGDWRPFGERREFQQAKDMPPGVIMKFLENQQAAQGESSFTLRRLYYFLALLGGIFCYGLFLLLDIGQNNHDSNQWLVRLMRYLHH